MTQTFTQIINLTAETRKEEEKIPSFEDAVPSEMVLQTILNFSKNLEIKHSKLIPAIQMLKS